MTQLDWSPEYPLRLSSQDVIPDSPGVYQVLTKTAFGRLGGSSRIVSIGSATPSLRRRLAGERMKDPKRYLSRAEKWLLDGGHELWFRFALTEAVRQEPSRQSYSWNMRQSTGSYPLPTTRTCLDQ